MSSSIFLDDGGIQDFVAEFAFVESNICFLFS